MFYEGACLDFGRFQVWLFLFASFGLMIMVLRLTSNEPGQRFQWRRLFFARAELFYVYRAMLGQGTYKLLILDRTCINSKRNTLIKYPLLIFVLEVSQPKSFEFWSWLLCISATIHDANEIPAFRKDAPCLFRFHVKHTQNKRDTDINIESQGKDKKLKKIVVMRRNKIFADQERRRNLFGGH